jgi:superfamily II DNA or RNA helicase
MAYSSASKSRRTKASSPASKSAPSATFSRLGVSQLRSHHLTKQFVSSLSLWNKLDEYQQNAVRFSLRARHAALFFEQGTGKTYIAGGVLEQLIELEHRKPYQFNALFIVPLANLESTWVKFLTKQVPGVVVCRSLDAYVAAGPKKPRVLLLHYEALPPIIKKVSKMLQWHLIVYDESQRLKDRASITSRMSAKLRDAGVYKLILSGTPIEHQPGDLWAQFRFLAPDVFGTRYKDFVDLYFEPAPVFDFKKHRRGSPGFMRQMLAYQIANRKRKFNLDKLTDFVDLIRPHTLRVTKDDVLDLPPIEYIKVPVDLVGRQRWVYDDLKNHMVSELGRSRVTAPLKITQIGKLQQVCGGFVFDDDDEVHMVGRAKLRAVSRIVKAETGPIVIFCRYIEEVRAIARELSIDPSNRIAMFTGRTNKRERPAIIDAFQLGQLDVLICQVRTGGVGIDLFKSCVAIFYSTTYSYIDFEQAVSRIHRRGQTRACKVFLVFARNTVDEVIYSALGKKRSLIGHVFVNLRREVKWQSRKQQEKSSSTALTSSRNSSASSGRAFASRSVSTTSRSLATNMAGTTRLSSRKSSTS